MSSQMLALGVLVSLGAMAALGPPRASGWTLWAADKAPAAAVEATVDHLVVSEVMTGGTSASDEFIELYNPTAADLPLEGLEIIYASASGATVTRKATWAVGEPTLPAGGHVLVANDAGAFAAVADATYANGLAATGGSVALRIVGATTAIDAVGWGTAASSWLEGTPAPAVAAGHTLERLPGGTAGSGQDTDANAVDFADRIVPDPENRAAPPIPMEPSPAATATGTATPTTPDTPTPTQTVSPIATPAWTPTPIPTLAATATPTPVATPWSTPIPTATPSPLLSVADARALPDGSIARVEALSLTDGIFFDGGGCIADATGGIAVLVTGGSFPRGATLSVSGEVDDRYHQRTLRAVPDEIVDLGPAAEPEPLAVTTGGVGEAFECRLVAAAGTIVSSATPLSGALAYDFDDGSGPTRLVVPDASGVDTAAWSRGTNLALRGVVIQRDASGSGTTGYRLTLRDAADVLAVQPPGPSPTASSSPSPTRSPGPSHDPSVVSIAVARDAAPNSRLRVRGIVTLPTSVLGDGTAAIQDATGAIILRVSEEAGALAIGDLVQVDGVRSTKSGMETLRVSTPPQVLGSPAAPAPARHATGSLGEAHEARLVVVRAAIATTPRRTTAQNLYFDVDDGSGPLRVYLTPGSGIVATSLAAGDSVELVGVLGQETSGQQPLRGYRLWPRRAADVKRIASATAEPDDDSAGGADTRPGAGIGAGTGGLTPNASSPGPAAAWPAGIPAPRLVPLAPSATTRDPGPTSTPDPQPTDTAPPPPVLPVWLLLVAAGVLGAVAAVAAARPGIGDRLREAVRQLIGPRARPEAVDGTPSESEPAAGSGVEAAVARLVPLRIVDEPSSVEGALSVDSRSAVRRILPPT
jgi:hypothetical protein